MTVRARWALVVVVLVAAATVALWPRGSAGPQAQSEPPPPQPDVAAARVAAHLPPCPAASPVPVKGLDVRTTCLGDGSSVDAGAVLGGAPTLVNVWAHWCGPCRDELPVLAGYAAAPGAVRVIGLQVQGPAADGLGLLSGIGVRLPMLYDGDGAVSRALHVPATLPASYLIGADGSVHFVQNPRVFRSAEQIRAAVQTYLGGP